jgi:hypothetical protein
MEITVPALPNGAVPDTVAVPLPWSVTVSQLGIPVAVIVAIGSAVVVTVKLLFVPSTKVVDTALVIVGAS